MEGRPESFTVLTTPDFFLYPEAVVSKQAGNCRSSAGYLIVCRRLLWSKQSARDKQSWRCFLSLRQQSNFTRNFAAIIHMQKDVSVVKKNSNCALCPVPYACVFCR